MAKRRANGEGNIRKRSDGRWEGRYTAGRDPDTGKVIYKNVLAKNQKECKVKLQRAIDENAKVDAIRAEQYTVGQWMDVWFENCAKIKVRPSAHKTLSAPMRFCNFSPNTECKKTANKSVQPLNNYTCRFRPSSLKCTDKSGLDGLQADKSVGN